MQTHWIWIQYIRHANNVSERIFEKDNFEKNWQMATKVTQHAKSYEILLETQI